MFVDEKAQGEAKTAEQANRQLKLSEAIRIGAKIRPQCKGVAFSNGASCAWGAAYEGSGGKYDESIGYAQIAFSVSAKLNADGAYGNGRYSIASMNDSGMSRESIADFLEAQGY